jgi:starch synthase
MSRLVHQKGPDVVLEALPSLVEEGMQFALVAEGDKDCEREFMRLASEYPGDIAVVIGYREPLAHRLLAGADMLLHPSRFEPCGLVPIYALRYGTIPVVRRTGGMADSVIDACPETIAHGTATGICFSDITRSDLVEGVARARSLYGLPIVWRKMQTAAMRQDFSWRQSADAYNALYRSLIQAPATLTEDQLVRMSA